MLIATQLYPQNDMLGGNYMFPVTYLHRPDYAIDHLRNDVI